jgi:Fe2+ or Zn2+ uptake regulation protein
MRVTAQREVLFDLLYESRAHPTADALFDAARAITPSISLRTVYQTLHDLVAMGEIRDVVVGSGPQRFDPNVGDHHHVVCSGCGSIDDVEFPLDAGDASNISSAARADGFSIEAIEIVVRGRCATCRGSAPPCS